MSERGLTRSSLSPHAPTKYLAFICEECGAQLSTMMEVGKHRKKVHGYGRFFCDHCNAGFRTKNLLQQHKCLMEQSTLKVFDKLPRDTGSRKMIKLEVKDEPEFEPMDTSTILPSSSTCGSVDFQHATPTMPMPPPLLQRLYLKSELNSIIAREHSYAATHVRADTPVSACSIIPRITKPCRIVPNTGPSQHFSGAIREHEEQHPQLRLPSLRPNPASTSSKRGRPCRVVPRYCPQCALFLTMSSTQFIQHKATHKINRPRLANTGASKALAQVSHSSPLPASVAKSMPKPPIIFGAAKKTTITRQGGNTCKKQQRQASNAKISPAQTTQTCRAREIPVLAPLSCPGEPLDADTAIIHSPEQPASSVNSPSTSTTSPSIHPAPSVSLSTSPPEVITLEDDEPAMLLKIFNKRTIFRQRRHFGWQNTM